VTGGNVMTALEEGHSFSPVKRSFAMGSRSLSDGGRLLSIALHSGILAFVGGTTTVSLEVVCGGEGGYAMGAVS
jgi:hypothetical protein